MALFTSFTQSISNLLDQADEVAAESIANNSNPSHSVAGTATATSSSTKPAQSSSDSVAALKSPLEASPVVSGVESIVSDSTEQTSRPTLPDSESEQKPATSQSSPPKPQPSFPPQPIANGHGTGLTNVSQEDDPDADLSLNSIFSSLLTGERLQKASDSKSHSADEHELTRLREALAERENEVASLTAVWNESRTKVSRMQKALERAQDLHATELETCERKAQEKLEALMSKHRTEVDELARQRSTHMQNVQTDVAERDRELNQARTEAAEARAASALAVDESAKLQRLISELQSEVQALTAAADATSEAHALVVRSMREEFAKRELAKEEETRILSSTRFSSSSRESSLESHALESSQALAQVHRELEDKSAQLQKLQSERRWLEADRDSARAELLTARDKILSEQSAWAQERASFADRLRELRAVEEQHRVQMQQQVESRAADQRTIASLRAQLAAVESNATGGISSQADAEISAKLQSVTEQLLAKQAQLEHAISEHAVAKMQLQQQITRSDLLQQQVDLLRADVEDVPLLLNSNNSTPSSASNVDLERGVAAPAGGDALRARWSVVKGGERASSSKTIESLRQLRSAPSITTTLSVLDSVGSQLGQLLRVRPALRVAFVLYIVFVHLYTIVLVSHVMDHLPTHVQH